MESAEEAGLGRWAGNRIMRTEYGYNHTGSMTGTRARVHPNQSETPSMLIVIDQNVGGYPQY